MSRDEMIEEIIDGLVKLGIVELEQENVETSTCKSKPHML